MDVAPPNKRMKLTSANASLRGVWVRGSACAFAHRALAAHAQRQAAHPGSTMPAIDILTVLLPRLADQVGECGGASAYVRRTDDALSRCIGTMQT